MLKVHKICLAVDRALKLWLWHLWVDFIFRVCFGPVIIIFLPLAALLGPGMMGTSLDCLQTPANQLCCLYQSGEFCPNPQKPKLPEQTPALVKLPKYEKISDLLLNPLGIGTRLLRTSMFYTVLGLPSSAGYHHCQQEMQ